MAQNKREAQAVRTIVLRDGTIKTSAAPSEFRSTNKQASMANAIAARRLEMQTAGTKKAGVK